MFSWWEDQAYNIILHLITWKITLSERQENDKLALWMVSEIIFPRTRKKCLNSWSMLTCQNQGVDRLKYCPQYKRPVWCVIEGLISHSQKYLNWRLRRKLYDINKIGQHDINQKEILHMRVREIRGQKWHCFHCCENSHKEWSWVMTKWTISFGYHWRSISALSKN